MTTTAVNPSIQPREAPPAMYSRWTTAMVEMMPQVEGERYEIIDGALYVTTTPHLNHQVVITNIVSMLQIWGKQSKLGRAVSTPGIVYRDDLAVVPDLVWCRRDRLDSIVDQAGHFTESPDLVVEVLSPGKANEERDREKKLALYDREGVQEYWIADWRARTLEVYRRTDQAALALVMTLGVDQTLASPLLPGFTVLVESLFEI